MAENYDDTMQWLATEITKADSDLVLAGIYANKPGYHNKRNNLSSSDYSVTLPADKKGPSDKASALDITSKKAQSGDYTNIKKYSNRLYAAGKSKDPRMDGWREFFGQTDNDGGVEGWDFYYDKDSTSNDKTHNWHIHGSELREFNTNKVNKEAFLSVWKGETLEAYKARGGKFVTKSTAPPAPPKPPANNTLEQGDSGTAVRRLQEFFRNVFPAYRSTVTVKRGSLLSVDGEFGPQTKAWVVEFQKRTNITRDGIVGPTTLGKMRSYGYKY